MWSWDRGRCRLAPPLETRLAGRHRGAPAVPARRNREKPVSAPTVAPPPPAAELRLDPGLIGRFAAIVGEKYALTDPVAQEPYLVEHRGLWRGHSPLVLRPGTVAEVAAILALANEAGVPVVPQGGNTGLVGGGIPHHGEI